MATDSAKYRFTVKEGVGGVVFLALEPLGGELPIVGRGHLGIDLRPGTTLEEAQSLARDLNDEVVGLSYWTAS